MGNTNDSSNSSSSSSSRSSSKSLPTATTTMSLLLSVAAFLITTQLAVTTEAFSHHPVASLTPRLMTPTSPRHFLYRQDGTSNENNDLRELKAAKDAERFHRSLLAARLEMERSRGTPVLPLAVDLADEFEVQETNSLKMIQTGTATSEEASIGLQQGARQVSRSLLEARLAMESRARSVVVEAVSTRSVSDPIREDATVEPLQSPSVVSSNPEEDLSRLAKNKASSTTTSEEGARRVSSFAFQRSLLEARLKMESRTRDIVAALPTKSVSDPIREDATVEPLQSPSAVMSNPKEDDLSRQAKKSFLVKEASSTTTSEAGSSQVSQFAFQRSLLEARLTMEARVANKVDETARIVPEAVKASSTTTTTSEAGSTRRVSPFAFQRSLLEARLMMEARAAKKVDETTIRIVPPSAPKSGEASYAVVVKEAPAELVTPPIADNDKAPITRPKGEPTGASLSDYASGILNAFTPETGILELKEQNDIDEFELLGYAASRVTQGVVEGTKAMWLLTLGATGNNTRTTPFETNRIVETANKSANQFASAFAAFAALGLRLGDRTRDYADQIQMERVEAERIAEEARKAEEERRKVERLDAERIAEEARKAEEERRRVEEARMAVETKIEEKRIALERKALEDIRVRADSMKRSVDDETAAAEKKALDEIKMETQVEKQRLLEDLLENNKEDVDAKISGLSQEGQPVKKPFFANLID